MRAIPSLLSSCLCLCLLAACEPPPPEGANTSASLETQAFSAGNDDSHSQGTQLHGSNYMGFKFADATVLYENVRRDATLRLFRGELMAKMPLALSGTTPSLAPCVGWASGQNRACGFTAMGQGTCTPFTAVSLSSGSCAGSAGSCTGRPVLRVCSGERPCEHGGTGYLASDVGTVETLNICQSYCPSVRFTCPKSGIFTVLGAPYTSGQAWSMPLRASSSRFPMTYLELKGEQLVGTRLLSSSPSGYGTVVEITEATNADQVAIEETPGIWDSSGSTFLYRMKVHASSGLITDLCTTGADPAQGWAWTVAVSGVFNKAGDRAESTSTFTLACDPGVIAKCYRWGYKPWLDGSTPGAVTKAHWSCTRMARADYCGNGSSFTKDGTRIRPWDDLTPTIIAPPLPGSASPDMEFEAGWDTKGPACLSHWRWKHLQARCVDLNEPIEDSDGRVTNDCRDPHNIAGPVSGGKCSQICDNAQEAASLYQSSVFNTSEVNEQP